MKSMQILARQLLWNSNPDMFVSCNYKFACPLFAIQCSNIFIGNFWQLNWFLNELLMLTHKFLGFCVKLLTIYHFLILSHFPAVGLTDIMYGYIITLYLQVSLLFVCWVSFHAFFVFLPTFFHNELFQKFFQDRLSPAIGPNCWQSLVPSL